MKNSFYIIALFSILFTISCSSSIEKSNDQPNSRNAVSKDTTSDKPNSEANDNNVVTEKTDEPKSENKETTSVTTITKKQCEQVDTGDNILLKSQTFPFDAKPFEGTCFVTEHNPEFDDPPIGSEISLYKDGKRIYRFDSRYNPDSATCYVVGVAFQDLNDDGLKDVIVAGKCGAKSGEIIGNEVFINTGKDFYTSTEANDKLEEFTKIKDIADFVRKNKKDFLPRG